MSDLAKTEDTLACYRCKAPMEQVVWIAPAQGDPGLIAYECPSCGYVTSVIVPPHTEPTREAAMGAFAKSWRRE